MICLNIQNRERPDSEDHQVVLCRAVGAFWLLFRHCDEVRSEVYLLRLNSVSSQSVEQVLKSELLLASLERVVGSDEPMLPGASAQPAWLVKEELVGLVCSRH